MDDQTTIHERAKRAGRVSRRRAELVDASRFGLDRYYARMASRLSLRLVGVDDATSAA